jgi:asparagine synthase (glutamine-hydrolysing)
MVLHNADHLDAAMQKSLIDQLAEANRVSQGLLLPQETGNELTEIKRNLGFVPTIFLVWAQIGKATTSLLNDDMRNRFRERDPLRVLLDQLDVQRQMHGRDAVNQSLYLWSKTTLPNYILSNLGDRMEMAHSVEGRLPFLDHHVVEAVARMPIAMKINGMTEKYVLREAARPVLTDTVYKRQKHPFLSPPATLETDSPLYTLVQDTLRGSALDGPGIYDRRKIADFLDMVPSFDTAGRTRADPLLTWLTSICLIHQRLGVSAAVDSSAEAVATPELVLAN